MIPTKAIKDAADKSNWLQVKELYAEEIAETNKEAVRGFVERLYKNDSFNQSVFIGKADMKKHLKTYLSQQREKDKDE